jgi:hypothetical protein
MHIDAIVGPSPIIPAKVTNQMEPDTRSVWTR